MDISSRAGRHASQGLVFLAASLLVIGAARTQTQVRSARAILAEYSAVPMPVSSDDGSPSAIARFIKAVRSGARRKVDLARELYVSHPSHQRVSELLRDRWVLMTNTLGMAEHVVTEARMIIAEHRDEALKRDACLAKCWAAIQVREMSEKDRLGHVEAAILKCSDAMRLPRYVYEMATLRVADPARVAKLLDLIERKWPKNRSLAREIRTTRRGLARLGKPLKLQLGAKPVDFSLTDEHAFTIVQVVHSTRAGLEQAAKDLKVIRAQDDRMHLLTVFSLKEGDSQASARKQTARLGTDWPTHFERGAEWEGLLSLGNLLIDSRGRLVAFSRDPRTLARRVAILRGSSSATKKLDLASRMSSRLRTGTLGGARGL